MNRPCSALSLVLSASLLVPAVFALVPYDAVSGFTAKALVHGVRFNLIVNDSDSDRREAAIGIATEAFLSGSAANIPVIRFADDVAPVGCGK